MGTKILNPDYKPEVFLHLLMELFTTGQRQ
jgi:hypothetical protein